MMNQHDTTMMIAGQIVSALAAQTGEDIFDPIIPEDYAPDAKGQYLKNKAGYFYKKPLGYGAPEPSAAELFSLSTTYQERIARYAAHVAPLTVHAVQRQLNKS